ncbi:hypothetical protein CC80DRAFT_556232 [Byssothecium circinans]|uniref:Uncharacterized protein n=1 Tax=Byssothecium circinans TaxID=147558 RepID=A0A6A5T8J0_9PLEO|nr:hypothetical protein CC80DRAFT_556232 [Byssothecium circinans]
MLDSLHRAMGTKDEDWDIEYQSSEVRVKEGLERLEKGDFTGFSQALYSRVLYPTGDCDFETKRGSDNEKLGLGTEDMDESTRWVVEKVDEVDDLMEISVSASA